MSIRENEPSTILVEENHYFDVNLGVLSDTSWKKAQGIIEVQIPYTGDLFKDDAGVEETLPLGEVVVEMPGGPETLSEKWPVKIAAGERWLNYLKSGKRAVCRAEYEVQQPQEMLVFVQGEIWDTPVKALDELPASNQGVFQNPLQLQLSLWLPDLYKTNLEEPAEEITRLLLRRQHTQQIFMQKSGLQLQFEEKLAEHLAALANAYGGFILVGVSDDGKVNGLSSEEVQKMPYYVLSALLQTYPHVSLQRAEISQTREGAIYLLKVGRKERGVMHTANGVIYRRENGKNVRVPTTAVPSPPSSPSPESLAEIAAMDDAGQPIFKHTDKVVALEGAPDLDGLRLGRYICGLINVHLDNKQLDVVTLILRYPRQTSPIKRNKIEASLKKELNKITPNLPPGNMSITLKATDTYTFAIVAISVRHIPVALYENQGGYIWQKDGTLAPVPADELLDRYLFGSDKVSHNHSLVTLEQARVKWPIRPPENMQSRHKLENTAVFSVQHQALVWQANAFIKENDTAGYATSLQLPLKNAALTLGDDGKVLSQSPVAAGQMIICLEDVLVSGCQISVAIDEDDHDNYLYNLPVIRRTRLHLDFLARLDELFKQRPKWTHFEFSLPNVRLDSERVRDMLQACADVGFRIDVAEPAYTIPELSLLPEVNIFRDGKRPYEENGRLLIPNGLVSGIRSSGFFDIQLYLWWISAHTEVSRELRYEDVYDTVRAHTHTVTYHIYLWGRGEGVQSEIGQLQMNLYELIYHRLQQVDVA